MKKSLFSLFRTIIILSICLIFTGCHQYFPKTPSPTPEVKTTPAPSSTPKIETAPINNFLITINIETNRLTIFRDNTKIKSYKVATGQIINGKCLTPTGKFIIVNKIKEPDWGGNGSSIPIAGGDPSNPLGHYWMGTSAPPNPGSSIGIHGNINYNSIGTHASHGCIRLYNNDIKELFYTIPPENVETDVWIGNSSQLSSWSLKDFN